jgi:hypothetical protein
MSTTKEFHHFQSLPSELRLRIWGFALAVPRDVDIACNTGIIQRGVPRTAKYFHSSTPPPALLHVCHESRFEGLKIYSPCFQTESSPRYIYVSFSQDTIKTDGSIIHYLRTPELRSIQTAVMDIKDPAYFVHFGIDILKQMQPNLTELELVVHPWEVWNWNQGQEYLQKVNGDFLDVIAADPEWRWPEIRIVEARTGELFERIFGCAAAPVEGLVDDS